MLREVEPGVFLPEIDDFIFEKDNVIPSEFCDYLVSKFEEDKEGQTVGTINDRYSINKDFKCTTDIHLQKNKKWYNDIDEFLKKYIAPTFLEYYESLGTIRQQLDINTIDYESIIFARYDIGGKFEWHFDQSYSSPTRFFQIIAYLNDPEEGGETYYGVLNKKIKPKKGKLIFAPSSYPFFHKSCPVIKGKKYNIIMQMRYNHK